MTTLSTSANSREACLVIDMPLHAYTDSDINVAHLVDNLLCDIADVGHGASHADILQALEITTAVRVAMADAASETGADFSLKFLDAMIVPASEAEVQGRFA